MPKTSKVTLGGKEYVMTEKVMGVSIKWREKLRQSSVMRLFESLDGALEQLVSAVNGLSDGEGKVNLNVIAGINIATIAPALIRGLSNSIDDVISLLFDYAPELKADEEWLQENAYNDELVMAFLEVLKLNFPILALWDRIAGSRAQPMSTNLPSTNGVNGTKKHTARSKAR